MRDGDDAAADAVALLSRMREQSLDAKRAGGGRDPAANGRVRRVAGMAAGGVEHGPAEGGVGQFASALPTRCR